MIIKTKRFCISLTEEEHQKFSDESKSRGISLAGYMRQSAYSQLTGKYKHLNNLSD